MEHVAVAYTVSLSFAKIVQKSGLQLLFAPVFLSPMANLFVSMGADRV